MFSTQPRTDPARRFDRAVFETLPHPGLRLAPLGGEPTATLAALELSVLVLVAALAMAAMIVSGL